MPLGGWQPSLVALFALLRCEPCTKCSSHVPPCSSRHARRAPRRSDETVKLTAAELDSEGPPRSRCWRCHRVAVHLRVDVSGNAVCLSN